MENNQTKAANDNRRKGLKKKRTVKNGRSEKSLASSIGDKNYICSETEKRIKKNSCKNNSVGRS